MKTNPKKAADLPFPSRFAAALFLCTLALSARAEVVHVQARSGEIGHGWMFGSTGSNPGECWVALPAHVALDRMSGELKPFFFRDRNGVDGESDTPLAGGLDGEATGAPTGAPTGAKAQANDLAFARVLVGRKHGGCLSRLGVPSFVYANLISSAPRMNVFHMLNTSFATFGVELRRGAVDEFGGAVLLFQPGSDADRAFLQKGISGATIMADHSGSATPFAMITRVSDKQDTAHALRFDYIKERFADVDAKDAASQRGQRASADGVPYNVLEYAGINVDGSDGPSALQGGAGCWRAAAQGGRSDVQLVIELADGKDAVQSMELQQSEDCTSGPLTYWIEQRARDGQDWIYVGKCETGGGEPAACRVGLTGPRQLRVKISARTKVAVKALVLR